MQPLAESALVVIANNIDRQLGGSGLDGRTEAVLPHAVRADGGCDLVA